MGWLSKDREKVQGVYGILCQANGKWYVGAGKNINVRFYNHFADARISPRHSHLYDDMQEYGRDSFEAYLLEEVDDTRILSQRELFWQKKLNSKDGGYNQEYAGKHRSW